VYHRAGREDFEWRQIDNVCVVGKSESIESVEIMALKGQLPEALILMRDIYHAQRLGWHLDADVEVN
jgi:hypothetical protein